MRDRREQLPAAVSALRDHGADDALREYLNLSTPSQAMELWREVRIHARLGNWRAARFVIGSAWKEFARRQQAAEVYQSGAFFRYSYRWFSFRAARREVSPIIRLDVAA